MLLRIFVGIRIRDPDPGSGCSDRIRIRIPTCQNTRIRPDPDPDPKHCFKLSQYFSPDIPALSPTTQVIHIQTAVILFPSVSDPVSFRPNPDPCFQKNGSGSWIRIPNLGSRILDPGSRVPDLGSQTSDPGPRIPDLGSRISDLGSGSRI